MTFMALLQFTGNQSIKSHFPNVKRYRWVLSSDLKVEILSHVLSPTGGEFQSLAAPIAKDLSPHRIFERCRGPLFSYLNPGLAEA